MTTGSDQVSPESVDRLLTDIRARVPLEPGCEVTLEANPGTFERERFRGYRQAGVTRLSIGVQSFDDSAVAIRVRIKTVPREQFPTGREFNRRLKHAFDARGIETVLLARQLENWYNDLVARIRGGDVAAVGSIPDGAPRMAMWNTYIWGDSADETAAALARMGVRHAPRAVDATCRDRENRIVSTPAYMLAERISEAAAGIERLVETGEGGRMMLQIDLHAADVDVPDVPLDQRADVSDGIGLGRKKAAPAFGRDGPRPWHGGFGGIVAAPGLGQGDSP